VLPETTEQGLFKTILQKCHISGGKKDSKEPKVGVRQ
jgi:hypothetical protein